VSPWLAMSVATAVIARLAQTVKHIDRPPLWWRPFVAADAMAFYPVKLLIPTALVFDHGRTPAYVMQEPTIYFAWIIPAMLILAAAVCWRRSRWPALMLGLLYIPVGPVLGLASFQMQYYSTVTDHYAYFAVTCLSVGCAWAVSRYRGMFWIAMVVVLPLWSVLAFRQTHVWLSNENLLWNNLRHNPNSFGSWNNLGVARLQREDLLEARTAFEAAMRSRPDQPLPMLNLAGLKIRMGELREGLELAEQALELNNRRPLSRAEDAAHVLKRVAQELQWTGDIERALAWARRALAATPDDPELIAYVARLERIWEQVGPATRSTTRPTTRMMEPGTATD
jgi:tetratricopeptide (TPR) repeat protein